MLCHVLHLRRRQLCLFLLSGKGEEQSLAAAVLTLLCLQMGSGPEGEEVFRSLKPLLITILTDTSASPIARQSVSKSFFFLKEKREFFSLDLKCRERYSFLVKGREVFPGTALYVQKDCSEWSCHNLALSPFPFSPSVCHCSRDVLLCGCCRHGGKSC